MRVVRSCTWHVQLAVKGLGERQPLPPRAGSSIWYMPLYEYKDSVYVLEGRAMEGRRRQNKEQRRIVAERATIGKEGVEMIIIGMQCAWQK